MPEPLNIFVSYSRRDKRWLEELQMHLAPLVRGGQVNLWDDTRIKAGAQWKKQIAQALEAADIAILLISHYFLASDFILDEELQPLLKTAEEKGLVILPVIVGHSRFQQTPSLSVFQAVNNPEKPLSDLPKPKQNKIFVQLTERIDEALKHRQAQRADGQATPEERSEEAHRLEEARSVGEPEPERAGSSEDQVEVVPPMVEEEAEEETEPVAEVEVPEAVSPVEEGEFVREEEAEPEAVPEEVAHPPELVSETSEEQVEPAAAEEAAPSPEPESKKPLPALEAEEEESSPAVEREKVPSPVHRTDSTQKWKRAAKWVGSVAGLVVVVLVLIQFLPLLLQFLQPGPQGSATSSTESPSPTFENGIGMAFILIGKGDFEMGSDKGDSDEKPVHPVTISQPFYLGKYEVTQGQWEAVMGTTPWREKQYVQEGDSFPAVYVSWDDAQVFIDSLNARSDSSRYRLPTEAEWEYAARAGTTTAYSFGNDAGELGEYAWYEANAWNADEKYAHQVGQKRPNVWRLYDMHGNVWEWVEDWYDTEYYQRSETTNPSGPSTGSSRVIRGGGWDDSAGSARSANRPDYAPGFRVSVLGFRLVRMAL